MTLLPDYYSVLEVPADATVEQIKRSYRRLARLHHPDVNKQGGELRIRELNEAYNVLSDPSRRVAYDIQRLEELRHVVMLQTMIMQRQKTLREQNMTWRQGMSGFVKELKKNMRDG